MFGDFSRFENDPEVGLNGIYLSQGSPILDSDWNEQVAALTDWITVVGRMAAGDTVRRIGFDVNPASNGSVLEISSGVALLSGRVVQCSRKMTCIPNGSSDPRIFIGRDFNWSQEQVGVYLVGVDQPFEKSNAKDRKGGQSSRTDWRIVVANNEILSFQDAAQGQENQDPSSTSIQVSGAKSYGDSAHMTAGMVLHWTQQDMRFRTMAQNSTVCLIECDSNTGDKPQFKVASSPENSFFPHEWMAEPDKDCETDEVTYIGESCAVLEMLTYRTQLWVEYEDDAMAFADTLSLLSTRPATIASRLQRAIYDPSTRKVRIESGKLKRPANASNPRLRLWNSIRASGFRFTLVEQEGKGDTDDVNRDRVQGEVVVGGGVVMIRGDRWYIPIRDGMPAMKSGERVSGKRPFRSIAKLKSVKVTPTNEGAILFSSLAERSDCDVAEKSTPSLAHGTVESSSVVPNREPLEPVAHRLDDSLHRLTGALNAARSLTRQTPCKELTTRVSYLPLRRWLASAYVHEIADLDLDGFLAKVRRSIDVAPEDEHRFREQAGLILEEANQLAGSITPRPRSETNRESDTMVSTPSDNSHPMTLGSATRDALQQAFTQEIPRA